MFRILLAIGCAFVLHAAFVLFGGLLVGTAKKSAGTTAEVQLLGDEDVAPEAQKEPEPPPEKEEQIETEQPPDSADMLRSLEVSAAANAPELDAASLSAIEAALSGQAGGGGDFAYGASLDSGGKIGGHGKSGAMGEDLDRAFSLAEIDQKPRALFQAAPVYPAELRSKKLEGVVTMIFVVDATGKVSNPRVESSTNAAFDKPALTAIKKWKFEPAVKGGQRVACKMRIPVRFQPR